MNKFIGKANSGKYGLLGQIDLTKIGELIKAGVLTPKVVKFKDGEHKLLDITINGLKQPREYETHSIAINDFKHTEIKQLDSKQSQDVEVDPEDLPF